MVESAIMSTGRWLGRLLVEEVRYLYGVTKKVEELRSELEWVHCILLEVDATQQNNAVIRKWVSQMQDLAYEAEVTIETFILKVSYQHRRDSFWSKVRWVLYCSRDVVALHEVGSDVDALVLKISRLTARLQTYGIDAKHEETSSSSAMRLGPRQSYSYSKEDVDIVGINDDIKKFGPRPSYSHHSEDVDFIVGVDHNDIEKLATELVNDQHHRVIALHGMTGIGKTRLARKVFHNHSVREHFSGGLAWAYVSKQFQTRNVLLTILLQLVPEKDSWRRRRIQELQDGELAGELYQVLRVNNCLVVLDDVWTSEDWNCLLPSLQVTDCNSLESKILVTTQKPKILSRLDSLVFYHKPKLLEDPDDWELLKKKAFGTTDEEIIGPEMIEVGKQMLKNCDGLPSKIFVLGGVLQTKETLKDWQKVLDEIRQYFERSRALTQSFAGVFDVLATSYHNLDSHLKRYFLFLALFPRDLEIPVKKLCRMWIAESTSASSKGVLGVNLEDAEYYLYELLQRHMVEVGKRGSRGQIKTCRLHDHMRDISLEMAKEENFLGIIDHHGAHGQSNVSFVLNERLIHLAIYVGLGQDVKSSLPDSSSGKAPNIRSLLLFPAPSCKQESCRWIRSICNDYQRLRVLDFEGFNIKGSLPKEVGNLIYLRYLCLKGTHITKLPSSITHLRRLETIDLRVVDVVLEIPNFLWKMKYLRYLYLPSQNLSKGLNVHKQGYKVWRGAMLRLDGLGNLETLEHIDTDRVDMMKGLPKFNNLRRCSATCSSRKESLEPFLESRSIEKLSLRIKGIVLSENPGMLSICQSILKLDIYDIISEPLPDIKFPDNLVKLGLWYCGLKGDPMPILEKLPLLSSLGIHGGYYESTMICSTGGFPQLTHLMIDDIEFPTEWRVQSGALSNLKKLEIYSSPIQMLPDTLPSSVDIACKPCVPGIEKYMTCPYFKRQGDRGD